MSEYRVRRFDSGRWDQQPRSVEAGSPEEAASLACGTAVRGHGRLACAEVWPTGGSPRDLATFFRAGNQHF